MLPVLILSTSALAETPLLAGELSGNAYTLPAKTLRLQIFSPSSYGVTDELELKSSVLGLLFGPNLTAEYKLMDTGDRAMSLSAGGDYFWDGSVIASVGGRYTLGSDSENRLSFRGGAGVSLDGEDSFISATVGAGYEVVVNPQTFWTFSGGTNLTQLAGGSLLGTTAGAEWTRGWEVYRLSLGLVVTDPSSVNASLELSGLDPISLPILPLPYFLMWWTI
jgi:hypothetical protein